MIYYLSCVFKHLYTLQSTWQHLSWWWQIIWLHKHAHHCIINATQTPMNKSFTVFVSSAHFANNVLSIVDLLYKELLQFFPSSTTAWKTLYHQRISIFYSISAKLSCVPWNDLGSWLFFQSLLNISHGNREVSNAVSLFGILSDIYYCKQFFKCNLSLMIDICLQILIERLFCNWFTTFEHTNL